MGGHLTEYRRDYMRAWRLARKDSHKTALLQTIATLRQQVSGEKLAYVAGIIDGEGCISFQIDQRARPLRGRIINTTTLRPSLYIGMVNKNCLEFIHRIIGFGSLKFKKGKRPWRDSWRYGVTGARNLSVILALVNPYLIVKKRHGELTYEYCMSRMFTNHPRFGAVNKSGYSEREREIAAEVKSLQL